MKVHHLNCISSCPLGGALMDGRGASVLRRGRLCCHCVLLEDANQLVLLDTGFGTRDVIEPGRRLSPFFLSLLSPDFRIEMTAVRQIQRLGFDPRDVRHIVLTHLDFDHAGGLDDFPHARVHLMRDEAEDALLQRSWLDRQRFRPQQWADRTRWRTYDAAAGGDSWMGLAAVRALEGISRDVAMVPLRGHTFGHAGIAFRDAGAWRLLAGDAYFHHREMDAQRPGCTPGLRFYQWMMEKDRDARLRNQQRLRVMRRERTEVSLFSSHDIPEFERLAARPADMPAGTPDAAAIGPVREQRDAPRSPGSDVFTG